MSDKPDSSLLVSDLPEIVRKIRARTPARILMGRAGAAYRTRRRWICAKPTQPRATPSARNSILKMFRRCFRAAMATLRNAHQATGKEEYLLRPDLGRHFDRASQGEIRRRCSPESDLQIAIGDGLSVPAVAAQVPPLLPLLHEGR